MRAPSDTCRSLSGVLDRLSDAVVISELLQRKRGISNSMTSTAVQAIGCPRCPLYLRDSPRLRVAPSVGQSRFECRSDLSPVGKRLKVLQALKVCQSFCLSVQTAAISRSAPSAATAKGGSLLTRADSSRLRFNQLVQGVKAAMPSATATWLRCTAQPCRRGAGHRCFDSLNKLIETQAARICPCQERATLCGGRRRRRTADRSGLNAQAKGLTDLEGLQYLQAFPHWREV